MPIYKYVTKERGLEILSTHNVCFTKVSRLNDPFENDYKTLLEMSLEGKDDFLKKAVGLEQHIHIKRQHQSDLRNWFALFCASRVPDNILMWSHYAGNHQGMVLGFGDAAKFLGEKYYGRHDENFNQDHLAGRTEYRKNFLVHYSNVKYIKLIGDPVIEPFRWKSLAWNYEEEFRVVRFLGEPIKGDFLSEGFEDHDLQEIYFGARFDKKEIADIKGRNDKAKEYTKAKYCQMELNNENYILVKKKVI